MQPKPQKMNTQLDMLRRSLFAKRFAFCHNTTEAISSLLSRDKKVKAHCFSEYEQGAKILESMILANEMLKEANSDC